MITIVKKEYSQMFSKLHLTQIIVLTWPLTQASKNPLAHSYLRVNPRSFSVSIDINYSEQKFAKETFKHLPSDFALIWVDFR